jgi:hypothetical protein
MPLLHTDLTERVVSEAESSPASEPEPEPAPEPAPSEEPEGLVLETDFDGTWPFGVPEVVLECRRGEVLVAVIGDDIYALNGAAIQTGFVELTLETPNRIWVDNPVTGAKVGIGDITSRARTLC